MFWNAEIQETTHRSNVGHVVKEEQGDVLLCEKQIHL